MSLSITYKFFRYLFACILNLYKTDFITAKLKIVTLTACDIIFLTTDDKPGHKSTLVSWLQVEPSQWPLSGSRRS